MNYLIVPVVLVALHLSHTQAASARMLGELIYKPHFDDYEMPESCEGMSFCFEKGDNYPDDKVAELLKDINFLQVESKDSQDFTIGSRNGFEYDEPDCPSNATEQPIHYILDESDTVRVVVQMPGRFQQIYTTKWCLNEGRITRDTPHFLKSTTLQQFNIECVSTRMNYDFFVLSEDSDNKMEIVQAKGGIPVCCRCRYNAED
ncbi:uncharacterized protein LOC113500854 [Trichoplusia ni]|uniref:Uncharacterized protein LOC113500854 n=1 Tax=Trichoplusia ni TaxID=7111 RepID=A0A7E5WBJ9_TRINI|nr:uncharacterized protein LOC113500854 [Trichoplusia ni]